VKHSAEELTRRGRRGELLLLARTVISQVTVLGGTVFLARLLEPANFGVYAFVLLVLGLFTLIGDAGLGAALIQREGLPDQRTLSSIFWLQMALALVVAAVMNLVASNIQLIWEQMRSWWAVSHQLQDLPSDTDWLLRALSVALVFSTARAVPSILMERELEFGRLAVLDIVGTLSFYGVAVGFAAAGYGVWALVLGVSLRAVITTILTFIFKRFKPQFIFDAHRVKPILRFGITFQAKNLMGFMNGAVVPLYGGAALGTRDLGYINWAQATGYFPLHLVEVMQRVTFPLLSRFQGDRTLFAGALERAVRISGLGTLYFVGLIFGIGAPLVSIIYTDKWLPAMPLLYVYAGVLSIGFITPLVASAVDAMGRPGIMLKLSLGWTVLAWIGVLYATPRWGMFGFAVGYSVHVVVGNVVVLGVLKLLIPQASVVSRLWAPAVGAAIIGLLGRHFLADHITNIGGVILGVLALLIVYMATVLLLDRAMLNALITVVRSRRT
jgi:O-antigen/teichoic acid export membrane protein